MAHATLTTYVESVTLRRSIATWCAAHRATATASTRFEQVSPRMRHQNRRERAANIFPLPDAGSASRHGCGVRPLSFVPPRTSAFGKYRLFAVRLDV